MSKATRKRISGTLLSLSMIFTTILPSISVSAQEKLISNIALNKPVTVSSLEVSDGRWTGEKVVDGDKTSPDSRWSSGRMKNDNAVDGDTQTPQWLIIDLGAKKSTIENIVISSHAKVWATQYSIETSDTKTGDWEEVHTITRANGSLPDNPVETIQDIKILKRYVRFNFKRLNINAAWHALSIKEIEINGTQEGLLAPSAAEVMGKITSLPAPTINTQEVEFPEVPEGFTMEIYGSDVKSIIGLDGKITKHNIGPRSVDVIVQVKSDTDSNDVAKKNFIISVPDKKSLHTNLYTNITNPNPEPKVIPSIQEWYGYNGNFTLKPTSRILINDVAEVGLASVAKNMQDDLKDFTGYTLKVEKVNSDSSVTWDDIYIESLTEDTYDTGKEGYLMVTDHKGIKIYSSTKTGSLYGTITTMQILWQDKENLAVPNGVIRDYPKYEIRGVMLDVARVPYRLQLLKDYAKILSWYKINEYHVHLNDNFFNPEGATHEFWMGEEGMHRLESKTFPGLKTNDKVKNASGADYFKNVYGNPHYTQDQWREFEREASDVGVNILAEIDTPGHSLAYVKYALDNPDNLDWLGLDKGIQHSRNSELLDLVGANSERATKFISELWKEYTDPKDPVFLGERVHIGVDEYWDASAGESFRKYINNLEEIVTGNGKKVRMWSGIGNFPGTTPVNKDKNIEMDYWTHYHENLNDRLAEGYDIVNVPQTMLYGNPGFGNRDIINAEFIFKDWDPTRFDGNIRMTKGDPQLLGAKTALWADHNRLGIIERDLNQRNLRAAAVLAEKTWGGTKPDATYPDYELKANALREGPGTQIAMHIDSKSSLVMEYEFEDLKQIGDKKVVRDLSGNGYDASIIGGNVVKDEEDTYLEFDGSTVMTTPLKTISFPYTMSMDLKLDNGNNNTKESSLFSGYDGRLQIAGRNGEVSMNRSFFEQSFGYKVPKDEKVNLTVVGTFQGTKLYVNGKLYNFLSQEESDPRYVPKDGTFYSSFPLPLEQIGKDFAGSIANMKVYNKALLPEILAGGSPDEVNVSQGTSATGEAYKTGDAWDQAIRKLNIPEKAIDGDGRNMLGEYTGVSTERNSQWLGFHDDSHLIVDMGQNRDISKVLIQWNGNGYGSNFKIQTSQDGKAWGDIHVENNNTKTLSAIEFTTPIEARFVKMQGVRRNGNNPYAIQEFEVYEKVDKTQLQELVELANDKVKVTDSFIFANAMLNSPIATKLEVKQALGALQEEIGDVETEGEKIKLIVEEDSESKEHLVVTVGSNENIGKLLSSDVLIKYDEDILELGEIKAVTPNQLLTDGNGVKDDKLGEVRILSAVLDNQGVLGATDLLKIKFKVKDSNITKSGVISATVNVGTIDDEGKGEMVELGTVIKPIFEEKEPGIDVEKGEFISAISTATSLVNNATIGSKPGNYHKEDVQKLKDAITAAQKVADSDANQVTIDAQLTLLEAAVLRFTDSVIKESQEFDKVDVNQDGKVDLADLALVAYHYRSKQTPGDISWEKGIGKCDLVKDGVIDMKDLVFIAQIILGLNK